MTHSMKKNSKINDLLDIMTALRDPQFGCPWNKKQTFDSIAIHTVEEAYEINDAINKKDYHELIGELGDLLFHLVFYAKIAQEQGMFVFFDIVDTLNKKLKRRHPHVFLNENF